MWREQHGTEILKSLQPGLVHKNKYLHPNPTIGVQTPKGTPAGEPVPTEQILPEGAYYHW